MDASKHLPLRAIFATTFASAVFCLPSLSPSLIINNNHTSRSAGSEDDVVLHTLISLSTLLLSTSFILPISSFLYHRFSSLSSPRSFSSRRRSSGFRVPGFCGAAVNAAAVVYLSEVCVVACFPGGSKRGGDVGWGLVGWVGVVVVSSGWYFGGGREGFRCVEREGKDGDG
ncbi:unnamed protein product [Periconia digitata]|uniref:Uncharacterized protein n=1 Tax=Periconia digitata TaxID=1303443 RepID=A0A9W4UMY1_9PLEO|nr:unnamed protein product [Periconia digitata]